ncbi:MAG TPA: phosphodiester glycosidase family protein [Syntrophomonadaceae bacterium]|nr:phosphodiester glycosidase family protein [Syntrophomonadaceae bacterium]
MYRPYKRILVVFLLVFLMSCTPPVKADVSSDSLVVEFSGGQRTVQIVRADLKDKTIRIEAAVAKNQIGLADELSSIAEQLSRPGREVVAAINGSYFSAYDGYPVPWNTIEKQGEFVHIGNTGSVIGFTGDNQVKIDNLFVGIKGATGGNWKWPDDWYAWGFNHMITDDGAVVIFTPAYGSTTGPHNNVSVVVRQGVITDIHQGQAAIPPDGYVIMDGDRSILDRFKVGKTIDYRLEFSKIDFSRGIDHEVAGAPLQWDQVRTTVGAGPTLLKNGNIIADGATEGFFEDKILTLRGARSFVGVTYDQVLVMGTVPNVTIRELGEIAQNIGLYQAITLDSNASSGLYYQGSYITRPGRELSNALVITRLAAPPVRIMLNNRELFFDADPVVVDGRTLVPMGVIFKEMGITPTYNAQNESIVVNAKGLDLAFKINSMTAAVNGKNQTLETPAMLINDRTYLPVRFFVESLGGKVVWDGSKNMVMITLQLPGQ